MNYHNMSYTHLDCLELERWYNKLKPSVPVWRTWQRLNWTTSTILIQTIYSKIQVYFCISSACASSPYLHFYHLPLLLAFSHLPPLTVRLHCWAVPVHSLAAALRLCSRVASPSTGVWCRTKHEKNVIDVSAVAVRKSSTPATDTTPGIETGRERKGDWETDRGERHRKETKEGWRKDV